MRYLVYQAQEKGCGFATVKMALIYMSSDRRYAFMREPRVEAAPDLATLISYASEAGLQLRGYEVTDPNELLQNTEYPLLVLLREEGRLHMSFLSKRRGNRFLLLDPARGVRWLKGQEMVSSWTGQFLRIEGYEKKAENVRYWQRPPLVVPSVLLFAFALLPMALMMVGLSLIDLNSPLPITLACLLGSIASSFGQRLFLLGAMGRFDKGYMSGVDAKFLKRRRDLYVHYHAYKRAAFVSKSEVFGHLAMVLAGLVYFLFHDGVLAATGALTVASAVGVHLLVSPHLSSLSAQCEVLEGNYFYALVEAPRREALREELSHQSRRYGLLLNLRESLTVALSLLIAFVGSLLQGGLTAQVILFYGFSCLFLALETEHLFQSYSLLEQKKKEEPYFLLNIAPDSL